MTATLIAVAHGTRDPAGLATHEALVARVRARAAGAPVRLAYLDHAHPSLLSVLDGLGGGPAVVVPLLLTAATHSKTDLPGLVREARRRGGRISYASPLGPHALLLEALELRLAEAGVPDSAAVVLAAAGAADPDANAEVAKVARLLWERRAAGRTDQPPVEPAYTTATAPDVPTAVRRLRLLGAASVAVAPYFLAPGRLPAAARPGDPDVLTAGVLGDCDPVADLVVQRYQEGLAGIAAAPCDTCFYRRPWPGKEQYAGAPQPLRLHPADLR
ncbi:MAG: sirohydrochlorin chelatase [Mycobacteriales bacterium]